MSVFAQVALSTLCTNTMISRLLSCYKGDCYERNE